MILPNIKQVQDRLLEMAVDVKNILEKHNIPYIITFGNLLGAVRHQGFIPWDDDFDFFLFDESYDKAIKILRSELNHKFFVEDGLTEPNFFHGWARVKDKYSTALYKYETKNSYYKNQGLGVDLFRAYEMQHKNLANFIFRENLNYIERLFKKGIITEEQYIANKFKIKLNNTDKVFEQSNEIIFGYALPSQFFYKKDIFPLKPIMFEGEYFLAPNNTDNLLKKFYGAYMEIPEIENRMSHYKSVTII